jgi:hypothetical protein
MHSFLIETVVLSARLPYLVGLEFQSECYLPSLSLKLTTCTESNFVQHILARGYGGNVTAWKASHW